MREFLQLLRRNRNYRYTWIGQVVSEIGDNFNNIAVFDLAIKLTGSGLVVTGIMLARAIPAVTIGPLAGVILDRFDRQRIMIASDLVRGVIALGFILAIGHVIHQKIENSKARRLVIRFGIDEDGGIAGMQFQTFFRL